MWGERCVYIDPRAAQGTMGWLRLVGSSKLDVSFAEYRLFYRALLQKRPIILRSLLMVATAYHTHLFTVSDTMQHTATHTATHCNTLQHTATHCNTLQHTATHCNTLQHTATHCTTLQHTATHCNTDLFIVHHDHDIS